MNTISRRSFLRLSAGTGLVAAGAASLGLSPSALAIEPINRAGKPRFMLSLAAYGFRDYFPWMRGKQKTIANSAKQMDMFKFVDYCADHNCEGAELTSYFFDPATTTADLLKLRARSSSDTTTTTTTTKVASDQKEPLQVAMQAARVAAEAIARRQESSQQDGMSLTVAEQQTVAGRVVGVALRWSVLESALVAQCRRASWVIQYGECDSFGVLAEELVLDDNRNDSTTTTSTSGDTSPSSITTALHQRIQQDPLFGLNRAECLLALFLHQVEIPELQRKNVTVPDDSVIDFLDADRKTVLLLQQ